MTTELGVAVAPTLFTEMARETVWKIAGQGAGVLLWGLRFSFVRYNTKLGKETLSRFSTGRGSFMDMRGINDVYGVGELEVAGSALIEAHERGHDLGDWQQMRFAHGLRCKNAKDRGQRPLA